jgi:broad specificity phosphatase PhoE
MKLHIYLFRHGETYFNRSKRFTGRINSRLNPKGVEQANLIAEKLKEKKFQMAFKTSLSRSSDSLEIVLRYHPECKSVIVDDRMIERSYGVFERSLHKTIIKNMVKNNLIFGIDPIGFLLLVVNQYKWLKRGFCLL